MKKAAAVAALASGATADLSLTWSDCGSSSTHAKITDFGPSKLVLGQKTTMTGHGQLDEQVTKANFDLKMTGALGTLLHCTGDASQSKTCSLPLATGSLTFDAMTFPIAPGKVPVSVDISLKSGLPTQLQSTTTTAKATDQNGAELFCIEIKSAPASAMSEIEDVLSMFWNMLSQAASHPLFASWSPPDSAFVQGGTLKLDWTDCGDASTHAKVTALSPSALPINGQKTTVTGSGNVDEQVTDGSFAITAKFGPVTEHYNGDVCSPKVFKLPAFLGTITWDGLKCPVAKGSVSVGVDVKLASMIPASLAKGTIEITGVDASKGKLLCLNLAVSKQAHDVVV